MADPDYFTLAEFRLLPDMDNTAKFTDSRVEDAAAYIIGIIEREVRASFIARTVTETLDGNSGDGLVLNTIYVRSVTSATVGGVASAYTLSAPGGVLRQVSGSSHVAWTKGLGNVVVVYVSGYSTLATIPADIKEAAMRGTRAYLLETASSAGVTDRRSSINNDAGTINYVIAGENRPTGYPQVDAVIMGWKARLDVPSIA